MVALEIGHGGGRILASSSRSFKRVIGVDIHDHNDIVYGELKNRGIINIQLFKTDGHSIPIEDASVDVVYSFIVLQHVEKIDTFKAYFAETHRILKPGGVAILYFGRKSFLSINKKFFLLYWIDCVLEKELMLKKGYMEVPARVNDVNLLVSLSFAKSVAKELGFKVLQKTVSRKNVPDRIDFFGGQHGLILKK